MRSVVASLDWCVKNAYSEIDSANLGRCIVHATDVKCKSLIPGGGLEQYKAHQLINPDIAFEKLIKDPSLLNAVTVWPIMKANMFYRLHNFYVKVSGLTFHIIIIIISSLIKHQASYGKLHERV